MPVQRFPSRPAGADAPLPFLVRVLTVRQADVARAAGVDAATFSRALHGNRALSPDTVARVEAAIIETVSGRGADR